MLVKQVQFTLLAQSAVGCLTTAEAEPPGQLSVSVEDDITLNVTVDIL